MYRRRLLAAIGVGATVESLCLGMFSGCRNGSTEPTTDAQATETATPTPTATPTETPTPTPTETPTPTPTPTETPTPTPTPTETPTPTPTGPPRHDLGERFVVGEGSAAFAYTAHQFWQADRIGSFGGYPAEGVFIVADLTVENLTDDKGPVPIESLILRGGVVKKVDVDATNDAENDRRLGRESLADVLTYPERPVRGVVVYDTPRDPSHDHRLRLTPPNDDSDAAAHVVPIGPYDELPTVG